MLATTAHGDAYTFAEFQALFARAGFLRSDSTGYGDSVAEAQMRRESPTATSTTATPSCPTRNAKPTST